MRSVSLVFARNLLLTGDSASGFPSAFALDGPGLPRESTCSTGLTCRTRNSAMPSTPPPEVAF